MPSSITGVVVEAWTRLIIWCEVVRSVISHEAPTDWIIEPMFEEKLAIQIARKAGKRNGPSARPGAVSPAGGGAALSEGPVSITFTTRREDTGVTYRSDHGEKITVSAGVGHERNGVFFH